MHELPVTMGVLSVVLQHAEKIQASKINRISLVVGELSGIVPDYITLQFNIISKDTIAYGAEIIFKEQPAELRCRNCTATFSPNGQEWVCPECGERKIEIVAGRECYVDSMEVV